MCLTHSPGHKNPVAIEKPPKQFILVVSIDCHLPSLIDYPLPPQIPQGSIQHFTKCSRKPRPSCRKTVQSNLRAVNSDRWCRKKPQYISKLSSSQPIKKKDEKEGDSCFVCRQQQSSQWDKPCIKRNLLKICPFTHKLYLVSPVSRYIFEFLRH